MDLTVSAFAANGDALPNVKLKLWYVVHQGETALASLLASSGAKSKTLKSVGPGHGADQDGEALDLVTGPDGTAVVHLMMPGTAAAAPSFDLWADFLPANERFHLNLQIQAQKLAPVPPPHVVAQSRLIQDYPYEPGNKIDATRDRTTWRTVVQCLNADGTKRPAEPLKVWATDHVDLEVNGQTYPINPQNSATFTADASGELALVLPAGDLKPPSLRVWAGFMHGNESLQVPLGDDAHAKLSAMKADDLTKPQTLNWTQRVSDPDPPASPLTKAKYHDSAPKVCEAIRHVMAVRNSPAVAPGVAPKSLSAAVAARKPVRDFAAMAQVAPVPAADAVRTMRAMRHMPRRRPVDPEGFRASLAQSLQLKDAIGFVFKPDATGTPTLTPINHIDELKTHFPGWSQQPRQPKLGRWGALGSAVSSGVHAVEHVGSEVVNGVAVFVDDQVHALVQLADKVITMVVDTVEKAIDAVISVIKMIELAIEMLIAFLRLLFEWKKIIRVHTRMRDVVTKLPDLLDQVIGSSRTAQLEALLKSTVSGLVSRASGALPANPLSLNGARAGDPHPDVTAQGNSVHAKWVTGKAQERPDLTVIPSMTSTATFASAPPGTADLAAMLVMAVSGISASSSLADIGASLNDALMAALATIEDLLAKGLADAAAGIAGMLRDILRLANQGIHIPLVSELYEFITDDDLTLLDVACLAVAVPAHIGYGVLTKVISGDFRTLSDDLGDDVLPAAVPDLPVPAQLMAGVSPAALQAGNPKLGADADTVARVEAFVYMHLISNTIAQACLFALEAKVASGTGTILLAITALATSVGGVSYLFWTVLPYEGLIWNEFDHVVHWTVYILSLLKSLMPLSEIFGGVGGGSLGEKIDTIKILVSFGALGLTLYDLGQFTFRQPVRYYQLRDTFSQLSIAMTFATSKWCKEEIGPTRALALAGLGALFSVTGSAMNTAAYEDHPAYDLTEDDLKDV